MRPSTYFSERQTFVLEIIINLSYPQFQIAHAIIFLLVLRFARMKVLRGQVDRAIGSVDNIVELVQRLPRISVVYGSPVRLVAGS